MDVRNLSREQIEERLKKAPRSALYDLIYSLATLEPHFSIADFAERRGLKRHTVRKLVRDRKLAAHTPNDRGDLRIPLSAIRDFDRRTLISSPNGDDAVQLTPAT